MVRRNLKILINKKMENQSQNEDKLERQLRTPIATPRVPKARAIEKPPLVNHNPPPQCIDLGRRCKVGGAVVFTLVHEVESS